VFSSSQGVAGQAERGRDREREICSNNRHILETFPCECAKNAALYISVFNSSFIVFHDTESTEKNLMRNNAWKVGSMWKEIVITYVRYYSGGTEKNFGNCQHSCAPSSD
jgi:hypothetical protein